ncbi:hypothetical protein MYAM1_002539 [Malassezia yamatoensis]|uniref:Uncharacterized protein n=1 Tax=Malassezia yamatoensis TaxID=253288 RepID=A0AAJ6CHE2_9BASI|nr:hypothetical protein MYAM1_002539 [Malassezia yamatoensis]
MMIHLKPAMSPALKHLEYIMVPDGVLHSKFAQRKSGKGIWVCNHQDVIEYLNFRHIYRVVEPKAVLSEHLPSLITYQMQQRIVQELQILTENKHKPENFQAQPSESVPAIILQVDSQNTEKARLTSVPGKCIEKTADSHASSSAFMPKRWVLVQDSAEFQYSSTLNGMLASKLLA